jgi:hypothetical protein
VKIAAILPFTLLLASTIAAAADPPDWLLAGWVLNNDLTVAAQSKKRSGGAPSFGGISSSVSIGGVFVPIPGSGSQASTGGSARDPQVLRCTELHVEMKGENVHFNYTGVGAETMKPGNNQGRVTRWNRKKLTSKYETTTRKVSKTYALQKDGTLLVTVKISPKQAAAIVQKRVFQRADS